MITLVFLNHSINQSVTHIFHDFLLLFTSSCISCRPQDFVSDLLEVEVHSSKIDRVFLGCQAWSLMTWKTMAILKGLVVPIAGNNHDEEEELVILPFKVERTERTCRSTNDNWSCDSIMWVLIWLLSSRSFPLYSSHSLLFTLLSLLMSGNEDSQADDNPKRKSRFIDSLESRSRKRKKYALFLPVELRINLVA